MLEKKITKGMMAIVLLAVLQAALRLYFSLASSGVLGPQLQSDVHSMIAKVMSEGDWNFLTIMFGLIGVMGLISAIGLLLTARWGFYGTIATSLVTIAYDAWATLEIQGSAALGIVLPVVFIAYLLISSYKASGARSVEGPGGVRN